MKDKSNLGSIVLKIGEKLQDELKDEKIKIVSTQSKEDINKEELNKLIEEYIYKHGITKVLSRKRLLEHVVKIDESQNIIVKVCHKHFDNLDYNCTLNIIDPYIFPDNYDSSYPKLLVDIITYFNDLKQLNFITNHSYNNSLFKEIKNNLNNNYDNLEVSLSMTDEFHDRFWLTDNKNGIFCGTSLNGLGKKYTIIDYLQEDDCKEIYNILFNKGLI